MSSFTVFAGTSGCTTRRNWIRASSVTEARSVSGSNGCLAMCALTEKTLSGASSQVWPSGALFATASAPMFWLPPVRFSTTTGCGHTPCSPWESVRAMVSGEPPGGRGTMIRTGRSGKAWESATVEKSATNPASSHLVMEPPPLAISRRTVYLLESAAYDGLSREEDPYVDPRGAGEAVRRRNAVPLADPGAVRVERRIHAEPAERAAEGIRGPDKGDGRRARQEARHDAAQVLQDRRRHGRGVRGDEPGARQEFSTFV